MSENITRGTLGMTAEDKTDWKRVEALTPEEVKRAGEEDLKEHGMVPDWTQAKLVRPKAKQSIHLRLDPDVIAWFKAQGRGYQTRMNAVLRTYVNAHKHDSSPSNAG